MEPDTDYVATSEHHNQALDCDYARAVVGFHFVQICCSYIIPTASNAQRAMRDVLKGRERRG